MGRVTLPSRFEPAAIETRWQQVWEEAGEFRAPDRPGANRFTIVLPPPNITGVLTIGHALGDTVMDLLCRHRRMNGASVLWLPGVDHAGLATQVAVRKHLQERGIVLDDLPREEIRTHVERWRREREEHIRRQMRALGLSVDWSRFRYTMDPGMVRATREVFFRLFRDGLIYRGERIVNWDPKLKTAVSDLEVLHTEEPGELLSVEYPWADGTGGGLLVATVRPETIFGDVAVAVHPDDERLRSAVGRYVRVPLTDRTVPVVTDPAVDPSFGHGALKVTPRHDPVDFEIFRRHPELSMPPTVLDEEARMVGPWVPHAFQGLERSAARERVREALDSAGLLRERQPIRHAVGRSERTKAVIEPWLSTQWFVRLADLAEPARRAVEEGTVRLHPGRWDRTYFRWMESLQDWCISRQVVWGHPIPVFYCEGCGTPYAAEVPPEACGKCRATHFRPDPDVLDTWFTSWLWPFAALGWPEASRDLAEYYPTSVLVTGRDIMFFWVARMIIAGLYVTGRAPFADVAFTGILRDELGRKLSKSLGNSPDPLEVVRQWGADTLRFALVYPGPADQDAGFDAARLEGGRNFLTKLWNVVRFAVGFFPEGMAPAGPQAPELGPEAPVEDRWILSAWGRCIGLVDRALAEFEFSRAATVLHHFLWHDLADRYIEIAKESLSGALGEAAARRSRAVLLYVVDRTLRALHPIVPHVTEELYRAIPHSDGGLVRARWPSPEEVRPDPEADLAIERLSETIRTLRALKAEHRVPAAELPPARVVASGVEVAALLRSEAPRIARLARVGRLEVRPAAEAVPAATARTVTALGEFFLDLPVGAADVAGLKRERDRLAALAEKTRKRLADPVFRSRAPPEVVGEAEEKLRELQQRMAKIDEHRTAEDGTEAEP